MSIDSQQLSSHQLSSCNYSLKIDVNIMSIEYLSVIINKIPEFLNSLSLRDICHLRETCNDLKNEADKKLIVTRDNRDIEVICQDRSYKKIRESGKNMRCVLDPFNDKMMIQWIMGDNGSRGVYLSTTLTVIEDNGDRRINIHIDVTTDDNEWDTIEDIKRISNDHYIGVLHRLCKSYVIHYLNINNTSIKVVYTKGDLVALSINRRVVYDVVEDRVLTAINSVERNDNDPFWVAINIVKSMLPTL